VSVTKHVVARIVTAALFVILLLPSFARPQQSAAPKRVLVLYWYNKDFPGNVLFDQSFQAALRSSPSRTVEYYPEYLESNRFPTEAHSLALSDYLRQKYAERPIDVVVAVTDASLDFLLKYRNDLFPRSPIVFVAAKRLTTEQLASGPGLTGIFPVSTHKETLDLALRLHPRTEAVFVISGTPERDKRFETIARNELEGYETRVKITYLTDLPLNELIAKTRVLPERSVVLYLWQQSINEQGQLLETWQTLERFAPSASAPIYGMGGVNVGFGMVGGYVSSSDTNGSRIGEITLRILRGERAQDIPIESAPAEYMFDWRELKRWNIGESQLPPGSVIRFRQYTFWEQNKWRITGVIALFLLQTSFITILLIERRRRQRAREALKQLNAELEQRVAARTAALDAKSRELETFAYSVAHDLKAPLRGIDGYSRLLLEDYAKDLDDEGRSFLETIQTSTEEMSQLIDDLLAYSRLERREFKPDRLDLQPLITTVVERKKHEATECRIDFVVNANGGSVVADPNGLTQSLSNLLDNAVKFTRHVPQPRIEVGSKETTTNCLLWVRDNGIGFDMRYHDRIFDIFQRLNKSEDYPGTGVGLAIVRKAMERMGGRAWAESQPGQGATFYLEIPK
jgi:signal transduction histidine kinase